MACELVTYKNELWSVYRYYSEYFCLNGKYYISINNFKYSYFHLSLKLKLNK